MARVGWVMRWRYKVRPHPLRTGIYRLFPSGYLVRARITSPLTGKTTEIVRPLRGSITIEEAQRTLDDLRQEARERARGQAPRLLSFGSFAFSLFKAKAAAGDIKSAKGFQKWKSCLELHLVPAFGDYACRDLRPWHFAKWREALAEKIAGGHRWTVKLRSGRTEERGTMLSPRTANGWIAQLRVICAAMTSQFDLDRDPSRDLKAFDTSQHPTYRREAPNALTGEMAARFLEEMRRLYPQHYAMTLLGFVTGKRPSTLRPLRASGPDADIDWTEGSVQFRRSHTVGRKTMGGTKTGTHEVVYLPPVVVEVLRGHVALMADPPISSWGKPPVWWRRKMGTSELLFPSVKGSLRSSGCLDKPFRDAATAAGVPFPLSPRAMRRTFNDLARAAKVHDVVTRSITGHRTESMQEHYSTANADEQRSAISNVIHLVIPATRKANP